MHCAWQQRSRGHQTPAAPDLAQMSSGAAPPGGREEQKLSLDGLPPLTFEQKWKWALIVVMSLLSCIASKVPQPVQIYIDQSYFNHLEPWGKWGASSQRSPLSGRLEGCHADTWGDG